MKNSFIVLLPGVSVSTLVVPSRTTFPPVESHLYSSTSTASVPLLSIAKCVTHAQLPDGRLVTPGTFESVAKVAISVLVLPAIELVTVCCEPPLPVGDHCLYVGVPIAVLVFADWLR